MGTLFLFKSFIAKKLFIGLTFIDADLSLNPPLIFLCFSS
jgi:hypothetical protein